MAKKKAQAELSPQAALSGAIKTARDIMRKDAGLSGEVDRIPQLAWLFFLKAFDDSERNRAVTDRRFRPAIEEPYRWRDWAADSVDGRTGEALLEFVNGELLPYLRNLSGTVEHDPRDVLAAVFKETYNRMLSGYLLRDVVNKVNEINFASSDDIHTMAHLYESMLREMRDAAGDSGEFYTPRPVIRFIVQQVNPQPGQVVLDPASGTGGFLVETFEHVRPSAKTTTQRKALERNLRGIEKKPLPYLLGMMNMLLHGVDQPSIVRDNSLAHPVTQIRKADRVDVVLTNPPFGGEEEESIRTNFPEGTRTAETALLFLQLIMRSLKEGGRCGMVVPNGVLFGDGIAARIKQQLMTACNLHTIVRLPSGVFAPYTDISTNLMFFEKTGRTKEVWFYEMWPPEGRKKYSKTRPMRFEEFAECQKWWGGSSRRGRKETDHSWRLPIGEIEAENFDLDRKNPNGPEDLAHKPPEELVADLLATEEEITALLHEIGSQLSKLPT
jgi:type I restriction enzyme M protein